MTATDPTPSLSPGQPDDTARALLDVAIAELAEGERPWASTSVADRAALLDRTHATVAATMRQWTQVAVAIKGLDPGSPLVGEEWISGPYSVLSSLALLAESLRAIAAGRSPLDGCTFGTAPGRRVTVPVLPHSAYEAILLNGFTAEVWMPPGVTAEETRRSAGLGARHPESTGGVGLVLGAGNITSIPPLDVLYELIASNRVAILKLNPVMDRMLPVFRAAFAPLIDHGVLRIVLGDGAVGGYLAHHPGISHVHITGSAATHDVVVFGAGEAGRERKASRTPLLTKPISSELGGVSPVIVVPGEWSAADLRFQAEHIATQRLHNGGYNCIAGQLVIVSSGWRQREVFVRELRDAMIRAFPRPPWYPGSDTRVAAAVDSFPVAERLAESRVLVDLGDGDASAIETTEYFAPVLGVIDVDGVGRDFLDAAIETANRDFLGTLGANVIIDPKTRKAMGEGFRESIAALRYGTIAVNAWTGVGFLTAGATWGGYPGHDLYDVQSGIGIVHNAMLISSPERTVVNGPFRPFPRSVLGGEFALFPTPPWFVTARSAATTGRRLAEFAAHPSWLRVPGILLSAFRA